MTEEMDALTEFVWMDSRRDFFLLEQCFNNQSPVQRCKLTATWHPVHNWVCCRGISYPCNCPFCLVNAMRSHLAASLLTDRNFETLAEVSNTIATNIIADPNLKAVCIPTNSPR